MSGISVTSLSFKTRQDLSVGVDIAAAVTLMGITGVPTFYINNRSQADGVWTVECLDRCAFLDVEINTSGWQPDSAGRYNISSFIGGLRSLGFTSVSLPYTSAYIARTAIDGKTYQTVLQEMSEVYCGFFCCTYLDELQFVSYNSAVTADTAEAWSRIHENGTFRYTAVSVQNGARASKAGSGTPALDINNELADPSSMSTYADLILTTFTGWSVDNYISSLTVFPAVGGTITFGNTTLRATRAEGRIVGNKLLISAGGDIPQYGEINRKGLLQRRLDDMVSTTKVYNNLKVTPQGVIAVPNPAQNS